PHGDRQNPSSGPEVPDEGAEGHRYCPRWREAPSRHVALRSWAKQEPRFARPMTLFKVLRPAQASRPALSAKLLHSGCAGDGGVGSADDRLATIIGEPALVILLGNVQRLEVRPYEDSENGSSTPPCGPAFSSRPANNAVFTFLREREFLKERKRTLVKMLLRKFNGTTRSELRPRLLVWHGVGTALSFPRAIELTDSTSAPIAGLDAPEQQVEDDLPRSIVLRERFCRNLLEGPDTVLEDRLGGFTESRAGSPRCFSSRSRRLGLAPAGGGGRARSTTKGGRGVVQVSPGYGPPEPAEVLIHRACDGLDDLEAVFPVHRAGSAAYARSLVFSGLALICFQGAPGGYPSVECHGSPLEAAPAAQAVDRRQPSMLKRSLLADPAYHHCWATFRRCGRWLAHAVLLTAATMPHRLNGADLLGKRPPLHASQRYRSRAAAAATSTAATSSLSQASAASCIKSPRAAQPAESPTFLRRVADASHQDPGGRADELACAPSCLCAEPPGHLQRRSKEPLGARQGLRRAARANPFVLRYVAELRLRAQRAGPGARQLLPCSTAVHSNAKNFQQARTTIRRTWGSLTLRVRRPPPASWFLPGPAGEPDTRPRLTQRLDYREHYRNMSLKHLERLRVDDPPLPVGAIPRQSRRRHLHGRGAPSCVSAAQPPDGFYCSNTRGAKPQRLRRGPKAKWARQPGGVRGGPLPAYCEGFGYAVRASRLPDLYLCSLFSKFFWIDDVYVTGVLAAAAKVPLAGFWAGHGYTGQLPSLASEKILDYIFLVADHNEFLEVVWHRLWRSVLQFSLDLTLGVAMDFVEEVGKAKNSTSHWLCRHSFGSAGAHLALQALILASAGTHIMALQVLILALQALNSGSAGTLLAHWQDSYSALQPARSSSASVYTKEPPPPLDTQLSEQAGLACELLLPAGARTTVSTVPAESFEEPGDAGNATSFVQLWLGVD
uniref:Rab-GAP TBC domain-containing protein n=1 Tax=Macrostomum lignano TaxID=282301 RepID=A0A1I8FG65_9PLAT